MKPKIHILYKFVDGPWGGGNQFLKALRDYFRKKGVYCEKAVDADVIIFNSYPFGSEYLFKKLYKLKKKHNKILIHRVDGPISYIRGKDKTIDNLIFNTNQLLADGTVFQSNWSMDKNYKLGMKKSPFENVITNAPDSTIFNKNDKKAFDKNRIKLIATSWSGNPRKGFDIYKYLEENLDFKKYEMTFVGNSPIEFNNINWIKPIPPKDLANFLKKHDIFITASKNDPCSNSLIEALHCGLPSVARNDSGHPEIIGNGGVFFENESDVISSIEKVCHNYFIYQKNINVPGLDFVGDNYYKFAVKIFEDFLNHKYHPRNLGFFDYGKFLAIKLKASFKRFF